MVRRHHSQVAGKADNKGTMASTTFTSEAKHGFPAPPAAPAGSAERQTESVTTFEHFTSADNTAAAGPGAWVAPALRSRSPRAPSWKHREEARATLGARGLSSISADNVIKAPSSAKADLVTSHRMLTRSQVAQAKSATSNVNTSDPASDLASQLSALTIRKTKEEINRQEGFTSLATKGDIRSGIAKKQRPPPRQTIPPPTPTQAYLDNIAAGPPNQLTEARKLLIILDLNGVLIYRPNSKNPKRFFRRHGLAEFLYYIFAHHHVMVWSSAKADNVNTIVDTLFPPLHRARVLAVWTRSDCGLRPQDFNQRVQVYKELDKVWRAVPVPTAPAVAVVQGPKTARAAAATARFGQHDTVLLDDSVLKASAQPWNLVEVSEWDGSDDAGLAAGGDCELARVTALVRELSLTSDVSRCLYWKAQEVKKARAGETKARDWEQTVLDRERATGDSGGVLLPVRGERPLVASTGSDW